MLFCPKFGMTSALEYCFLLWIGKERSVETRLVEEEEEETARDSYVPKVCVLWVQ